VERLLVDEKLKPTPYLVADGADALARFEIVSTTAGSIRERALSAARSIAIQAQGALGPFEAAVRSDLVAESNRMEGIPSSSSEIRKLVQIKRELLDADVGSFVEFLKDDPRMLDELGHYRAYAVADEWAKSDQRPREFELRALHGLVMASHECAGRYKTAPNEIGGSDHVPAHHWDTPRDMGDLGHWFETGTDDAVLDAAVVHAWLTHIHPFDDGNGRMARLLANLALIQAHYPPLLLRSGADRGQYLDALAASDDGDILPLYDLFAKSLRRVVRGMEHPRYVESKIRNELLGTVPQRRTAWKAIAQTLETCLEHKTRNSNWSVRLMGYPTEEDFRLLEERSPDGNSWFVKLRDRKEGRDEWLLWFGYRSDEMRDVLGGSDNWPSIFFAERTSDPRSVHPFKTRFEADGRRRPAEISLTPGRAKPVTLRWEYETHAMQVDEAAAIVVGALCR
jgi:Fic family protein